MPTTTVILCQKISTWVCVTQQNNVTISELMTNCWCLHLDLLNQLKPFCKSPHKVSMHCCMFPKGQTISYLEGEEYVFYVFFVFAVRMFFGCALIAEHFCFQFYISWGLTKPCWKIFFFTKHHTVPPPSY